MAIKRRHVCWMMVISGALVVAVAGYIWLWPSPAPRADDEGLVRAREALAYLSDHGYPSHEMYKDEQSESLRSAYPDRFESGLHDSDHKGAAEVSVQHRGKLDEDAPLTRILIRLRGDRRPSDAELKGICKLVLFAGGLKDDTETILEKLWAANGFDNASTKPARPEGEVERSGHFLLTVRQVELPELPAAAATEIDFYGKIPATTMQRAMLDAIYKAREKALLGED